MTQRDKMRDLYKQYNGNKQMVCRAYAAAERAGLVKRVRNSQNMSAEDYADPLWKDGIKKGWLTDEARQVA
jgi:hypothetical protein